MPSHQESGLPALTKAWSAGISPGFPPLNLLFDSHHLHHRMFFRHNQTVLAGSLLSDQPRPFFDASEAANQSLRQLAAPLKIQHLES